MNYFCPVGVDTVILIDPQCLYKKIIAFAIFVEVESDHSYFVEDMSIFGQFLIVIHLQNIHGFLIVDQTLLNAMAL